MQSKFFEFCTLENPIFIGGMIWLVIFMLTGCKMLDFKRQEADESAEKAKQAQNEELDIATKTFSSKKPATPSRREQPVKTRSNTRAQIVEVIAETPKSQLVQKSEVEVQIAPKKTEKPKKKKSSGKATPQQTSVIIPSLDLTKQMSELTNQEIDDGWEMPSSSRERQ